MKPFSLYEKYSHFKISMCLNSPIFLTEDLSQETRHTNLHPSDLGAFADSDYLLLGKYLHNSGHRYRSQLNYALYLFLSRAVLLILGQNMFFLK